MLAKFDPSKPVKFIHMVTDCEHDGDMRNDEYEVSEYVTPLGGKVIDSYWDGQDCGEAWIKCQVPYSALEKVLMDGFFDYEPWQ